MKKLVQILMIAMIVFSIVGCKKKSEEVTPDPVVPIDTVVIGDNYAGGIVFYVDATGQHGLVAATLDQSAGVAWNNGVNINVSGTGFLLGQGQANTTAIIATQGVGTYAASICDQLDLNGYTDWYLPSKNELDMLFQQKAIVGGFSSNSYWSSSQSDPADAWKQAFNTGYKLCYDKFAAFKVRAIRSF